MLPACWRRNSAQLVSKRLGAGSMPASLRIAQTVLAPILTPSPTTHPGSAGSPSPGSRLRAAPPAHGPRPASPADQGADADRSSDARSTPDATAEASPAAQRTTPTLAAATPGSTQPAAPDQPGSAADARPDARAHEAGGAAQVESPGGVAPPGALRSR